MCYSLARVQLFQHFYYVFLSRILFRILIVVVVVLSRFCRFQHEDVFQHYRLYAISTLIYYVSPPPVTITIYNLSLWVHWE